MRVFKYKNIKVLSVTILCMIIIIILTSIKDESIISNVVNTVTAPVQQLVTNIAVKAFGIENYSDNEKQLLNEIEILRNENNDLRDKIIDYYTVIEENNQLRTYYGIKEENPDFNLVNATVIRKESLYYFTLNKGEKNGISKNDIVITEYSLIGIVTSVSYSTCVVQTILSPSVKIGVKDSITGDTGVLTGNVTLSPNNKSQLIYISAQNNIKIGDIITTSGIGDMYPENIKIGKVTNILYDSYDTSIYAVVEIYDDISKVDKVAVITDFL